MKTFIGQESLFYALFYDKNIEVVKNVRALPYYDTKDSPPYEIEVEIDNNKGERERVKLIIIPFPDAALKANPTTKLNDLLLNYYVNPPENSIVVFDRWIYARNVQFIFEQYGIVEFKKLIEKYKKNNVRVIFNFAFFEPNEYETMYYFLMRYNYEIDCIKISDYELFKNDDNFVFSKIYNMFHIVGDLMSFEIRNYFFHQHKENKILPKLDTLFKIDEISKPEKIFSHLTLKPRPHRINFINNLYDLDIVDYGYCSLNKFMYDEYSRKKEEGMVYSTDGSLNNTKWLYDYFKDMEYRGYEYYSQKMPDTLGNDLWSHLRHYFEHKEYKKSYIDVVGETHILFNTLYPYFSEKSYYPILTEKFFIIYGGNSFYKMLEELDCYNSLDLFGLDKSYYEIESPYEQGNIIAQKMKELIDKINSGEFDIEKYYQENKYKLLDTKQKIFSKFNLEMQSVRDFVFKND